MKRIILNVDLDDNEVFEKEVADAIRAEVRKITRDEQLKLIQKEADKEFKRLVDADTYNYRDKLRNIVEGIILKNVRDAISSSDIKELVNEAVSQRISFYSDIIDDKCKEVMEKTVTAAVANKIKNLLT